MDPKPGNIVTNEFELGAGLEVRPEIKPSYLTDIPSVASHRSARLINAARVRRCAKDVPLFGKAKEGITSFILLILGGCTRNIRSDLLRN